MGSCHLNNSHSHQLKFNPDSFNYKQSKDTLREIGEVETIKSLMNWNIKSKIFQCIFYYYTL